MLAYGSKQSKCDEAQNIVPIYETSDLIDIVINCLKSNMGTPKEVMPLDLTYTTPH